MKIYTKTGDAGQTGLFAGPRVAKDDARIEAYGTVDELNAVLGTVLQADLPRELVDLVQRVQHELFAVGAELATPDPALHGCRLVGAPHIQQLEQEIDRLEAGLSPLRQFVLPGGTAASAALHMARSVCRRAERRVVTLARVSESPISAEVIIYLNRLSDLLFVAARTANAEAGVGDVPWEKPDAL